MSGGYGARVYADTVASRMAQSFAGFDDRLVDFQVDEDLAISVVTVPTPERQAAARERERRERRFPEFVSG